LNNAWLDIINCYATGDVFNAAMNAGGLVGSGGAAMSTWGGVLTIADSWASGNVTGYGKVGGLVGDSGKVNISGAHFGGTITNTHPLATTDDRYASGAFVGYSIPSASYVSIHDSSYNSDKVDGLGSVGTYTDGTVTVIANVTALSDQAYQAQFGGTIAAAAATQQHLAQVNADARYSHIDPAEWAKSHPQMNGQNSGGQSVQPGA
jgi:hypothetical protein